MNELTALTVFNIKQRDGLLLREIYEEKCFETKNYFLQNAAIPKVVISKCTRLRTIEEAFCCLDKSDFGFPDLQISEFTIQETGEFFGLKEFHMGEFFRKYNETTATFRLSLSQKKGASAIAEKILLLGQTESAYYAAWNHFFKNISEDVADKMGEENPKISATRDTMQLLRSFNFLVLHGLKNNMKGTEDEAVLLRLWEKPEYRADLRIIMTELLRVKKLSSQR